MYLSPLILVAHMIFYYGFDSFCAFVIRNHE
jgi:hypothetical protein